MLFNEGLNCSSLIYLLFPLYFGVFHVKVQTSGSMSHNQVLTFEEKTPTLQFSLTNAGQSPFDNFIKLKLTPTPH